MARPTKSPSPSTAPTTWPKPPRLIPERSPSTRPRLRRPAPRRSPRHQARGADPPPRGATQRAWAGSRPVAAAGRGGPTERVRAEPGKRDNAPRPAGAANSVTTDEDTASAAVAIGASDLDGDDL